MLELTLITLVFVCVSLVKDRDKTWQGIKKGLSMFIRLLPALVTMLMMVAVILWIIPEETIVRYLGTGSGASGWALAALFGSVSLIPGFIAFPLSSVLIKSGVAYSTIAVFITTLMMVGIVTLPLESRYFGLKTALVRNLLSLVAALLTGFLMAFLL